MYDRRRIDFSTKGEDNIRREEGAVVVAPLGRVEKLQFRSMGIIVVLSKESPVEVTESRYNLRRRSEQEQSSHWRSVRRETLALTESISSGLGKKVVLKCLRKHVVSEREESVSLTRFHFFVRIPSRERRRDRWPRAF